MTKLKLSESQQELKILQSNLKNKDITYEQRNNLESKISVLKREIRNLKKE